MKTLNTEQLKQIVELANSVPQEFREKCFELLLAHSLKMVQPVEPLVAPKQIAPSQQTPPHKPFVIPIDVKALLSQYSLDETRLWKLFLVDGSELRPLYKLNTTKRAKAQLQFALLMALENALMTGQFQVEIENLRTRCVDQKCYDKINFMNNLNYNKKYFKSVEKDQPLVLSPDGKAELADLIESLSD